jgi:RNA polymerase sigma-70 factor (ECF subfamily)
MHTIEFEAIYSEYFSTVYKYVFALSQNKDIAEDITQETFFKAFKSINSFKGQCKISVWLCQIAKNAYFTQYQETKNVILQDSVEVIDFSYDLENNFIQKERIKTMHRYLHNLKEPYKEVFTLRIFANLSFSEIGELFGRKDSWARLIFYRAKKQIQEECK